MYNRPVASESATTILSNDGKVPDFDLCVCPKCSNEGVMLPKLHMFIDTIIFPLLFPSNDYCWMFGTFQTENHKKKTDSIGPAALQYCAYRLMYRDTDKFNPIYYKNRFHWHYVIHVYI